MKRTLFLLAAGATCSAVLWFVQPGHARADTTGTITVGDAAEAWYQTPPADPCSSPVGCPPVSPPSPFPADTLHVGEAGSAQTDGAYVQPDLSSVPGGEEPIGGTMTLPLATVNGNGNANTAGATIVACLATASIPDGTEGSTNTPPASDCKVTAKVAAGADSFTIDLAPFLQAWNSGEPEDGIALLADTSQPSAWHVAFNGRNLAGAPHITSALTLGPVGAGGLGNVNLGGTIFGNTPAGSGLSSPGGASTSASGGPFALTPSIATPSAPSLAPATAAPPASPTPARQPSAGGVALAGVNRGFQYPEILLLPLVLAAGMAFAVRLLISDATPVSVRAKKA